MSTVICTQAGGSGEISSGTSTFLTNFVALGVRCTLAFVGTTTSWTWAITGGVTLVTANPSNPREPSFILTTSGQYTITFTDSSAAQTTLVIYAVPRIVPVEATVNVEHYSITAWGASPSASAITNTSAMRAAIAYAHSAGGGIVYVPEGSYSFDVPNLIKTVPQTLSGISNVTIRGAGRFKSKLVDLQGRAPNSEIFPTNSISGAFLYFEDSANITIEELGFVGSGTFNQTDMGRDAITRKAIWFRATTAAGCDNITIRNCYFTLIEGEVCYFDGNAAHFTKRFNISDNYFYRNQTNLINGGSAANGSFQIRANRNTMVSFGGAAFETQGDDVEFCENDMLMEPGLFYGSDAVLLTGSKGARIERNWFLGIHLSTGSSIIKIGASDSEAAHMARVTVDSNKFYDCTVLGIDGVGTNNCAVIMVACAQAASNYTDIEVTRNEIIDAGNTSAPYDIYTGAVGIRVTGARPIRLLIKDNKIPVGANAIPLTTGIDVGTGVANPNEITVGPNYIGGTITNPYRFTVAPLVSPQVYTVTNPSTDRGLNVSADTLAQGLAVLGTLIADLKDQGILR